MMTGVSPAHFTFTGMGAVMSFFPYWMRALIIHTSFPTLFTLMLVYLSSFSGPSWPSFREHQRPAMVALVSVALNLASSSSGVSWGLAGLVLADGSLDC